jgi:hypothetical protein
MKHTEIIKIECDYLLQKQQLLLDRIRAGRQDNAELLNQVEAAARPDILSGAVKELKQALLAARTGTGVSHKQTKQATISVQGMTARQGKVCGYPITIYHDKLSGSDFVKGADVERIETSIDGCFHAVQPVLTLADAETLISICKQIKSKAA